MEITGFLSGAMVFLSGGMRDYGSLMRFRVALMCSSVVVEGCRSDLFALFICEIFVGYGRDVFV